MKPDISEFSFGYAIVEDFSSNPTYPFSAAPAFLSLVEEGNRGYDVQLNFDGVPVFLQFKLSDCLVRDNAKEAALLGLPYFRMHLRSSRHSRQHELLLNLENVGNLVFYTAPMFHTTEELNSAYINHRVVQQSMFVTPSIIGPMHDMDEHYLSFNEQNDLFVCSKPKQVNKSDVGYSNFIKIVMSYLERGERTSRIEAMEKLLDQVIRIIEKSKQFGLWKDLDLVMLRSDRQPLFQVAYLARTFLGCEMLILRSKNR